MSCYFEQFRKSPDKLSIATASPANYVTVYDKDGPDAKSDKPSFIFRALPLYMSKNI